MGFKLISNDKNSRAGILSINNIEVQTPTFMPVATRGAIKSTPHQYLDKTSILLANAYHLHLRPGAQLINDLGGLHKFMNWDKLILTDSGGFQAWSLPTKLLNDGIEFKNVYDGSFFKMTPEESVNTQNLLGSDIAMIFDYLIETSKNTKIYLIKRHPCYEILKECDLAITTVGANTADLAAISLPMLVVLPTQHLNMMNAWDGIFGVIGKISFINRFLTFLIKNFYFKKKKFFAWPNIKAKRMIVPERIGNISTIKIAREVLYLLKNRDQLKSIKDNLNNERGDKGASKKLASIIVNSIKKL